MNADQTATAEQIETAREAGAADALEAIRDSLDCTTPYGGWDSWLIDAAGSRAAALAIGLETLCDAHGFRTAIASELLAAYAESAYEAAADAALSEWFAALVDAESDRQTSESEAIAKQNTEANEKHMAELVAACR